jgi:polyphosphate kinase 2 (PPK2 family)
MAAYEEAIRRCNTAWAPWHIIPANKKWYRDLLISERITRALEDMRLKYPRRRAGRGTPPDV